MTVPFRPKIGSAPPEEMRLPRNQEQRDERRREIVYWDDRDPRCVLNLVTAKVREKMTELPPAVLAMSEKELKKKLEPGWVLEQLRIAFWDEYFLSVDNDVKMRMDAVYGRVCSREQFYNTVDTPLALAYMAKPPADYIYQMRSLLNMGLERFNEILALPLENRDGTVNTKLIGEIIKIVTVVDNRVKGAVTQKIQIDGTQKNLNVNVNQTYEAPKSIDDINAELKRIEKEVKELQAPNSEVQMFEEQLEENVITSEDDDTITVEATRT